MPRVEAYVYDITQGMASRMSRMLIGKQIDVIPHTGIVVFGKEYFFGSGPCIGSPGQSVPCQVHEVLNLGETAKTCEELEAYINQVLAFEHTQERYNLLSHNCNHFADDVAKFLLDGKGLPASIVNVAEEALSTPQGQSLRAIIENFERQMRAGSSGAPSGLNPFGDVGSSPGLSALAPVSSAGAATSQMLEDACKEIATNPVEVRRTCLTTLLKITQNIEKNPAEEKYRRIKMENPVFISKLAGCDGGTEAMLAVGWVPTTHDGEDVWHMEDASAPLQAAYRRRFEAELAKLPAAPAPARAAPAPAPTPAPMDPMGGMGGLGGLGGMPGGMNPQMMQQMMNNPQMMAQAQQMMNNPQMMAQAQQMMQNPQMMAQMQQMMQNPQAMAQLQQMMGGGGGGFGGF